jgi:hypothetical protein
MSERLVFAGLGLYALNIAFTLAISRVIDQRVIDCGKRLSCDPGLVDVPFLVPWLAIEIIFAIPLALASLAFVMSIVRRRSPAAVAGLVLVGLNLALAVRLPA